MGTVYLCQDGIGRPPLASLQCRWTASGRLPDTAAKQVLFSMPVLRLSARSHPGPTGWWKEPVSTRLSFFNGQGAKYAIQWTIKYGNEPTIVNPLGTSLLDAKRHYHTITLPEGTTGAVLPFPNRRASCKSIGTTTPSRCLLTARQSPGEPCQPWASLSGSRSISSRPRMAHCSSRTSKSRVQDGGFQLVGDNSADNV